MSFLKQYTSLENIDIVEVDETLTEDELVNKVNSDFNDIMDASDLLETSIVTVEEAEEQDAIYTTVVEQCRLNDTEVPDSTVKAFEYARRNAVMTLGLNPNEIEMTASTEDDNKEDKGFFKKIWDWIKDTFNKLIKKIKSFFNWFVKLFKGVPVQVKAIHGALKNMSDESFKEELDKILAFGREKDTYEVLASKDGDFEDYGRVTKDIMKFQDATKKGISTKWKEFKNKFVKDEDEKAENINEMTRNLKNDINGIISKHTDSILVIGNYGYELDKILFEGKVESKILYKHELKFTRKGLVDALVTGKDYINIIEKNNRTMANIEKEILVTEKSYHGTSSIKATKAMTLITLRFNKAVLDLTMEAFKQFRLAVELGGKITKKKSIEH